MNYSRLSPFFIVFAFTLGLLVGYLLWGRSPAQVTVANAPSATQDQASPTQANAGANTAATSQAAQDQQIRRYDVPVDDDPVLGPADAPITLIEFSDYECPYCRKWHEEVLQPLMDAFPNQIRFIYRDFPLTSAHPNALPAAEAADCAGEQGKYYEYQDLLFSGKQALGDETYQQYAEELDLDSDSFKECTSSERYKDEVMADLNWASNLGVRSTPTFFINGLPLVGAQPFEVFQEVITKELAGEYPK